MGGRTKTGEIGHTQGSQKLIVAMLKLFLHDVIWRFGRGRARGDSTFREVENEKVGVADDNGFLGCGGLGLSFAE